MVRGWLQTLSIAYVILAIVCAVVVLADLVARPQKMWIMNLVWPLTALYAGPFALWAYHVSGREPRRHASLQHAIAGGAPAGMAPEERGAAEPPFWQPVLVGSTHCGAGCAVGDFIGAWLVFATGLVLLGSMLFTHYLVAFVLAYAFGIFFQYFAIAPMRGLGFRAGLRAAVKADTLSLTAYEIGMFAWMAVTQKLLFPGLEPRSWTFWLMMQIAMMLGLATTFPANWWLIRRGVKEAM